MTIFPRRLVASLILLSACLINTSDGDSVAHAKNEVRVSANSTPVAAFRNCGDSVIRNCIVSVKYNDSDITFVGNTTFNGRGATCNEVKNPRNQIYSKKGILSGECYQDIAPTYAADPVQFSSARSPLSSASSPRSGLRILIAKSPESYQAEIQGGPSFNYLKYFTWFQPVFNQTTADPTANPTIRPADEELFVVPAEYLPEDSWTVKINFGPVPPPNFYALAGIDSYVTSYDVLGNAIIELKIRPLLLTFPGNGDQCNANQGANDRLMIGSAAFYSALLEGDSENKVFRFMNGFAIGSNSTCRFQDAYLKKDGAMEIGVSANHLKADGSLNKGYFSAVFSPSALQGFNVSPDLVLRGGLKVTRAENGKASELASTSEIQPDGSIRITATGFHYSAGTISVKRNEKMPLPPGKTTIAASVKTIKTGMVTNIKANVKKASGRLHVFIVGAKGQKWSLGSGLITKGVANVDVVVPSIFPKGKTSLLLWYEGSSSLRPATKVLSVLIR